jgi:hypothetical protein
VTEADIEALRQAAETKKNILSGSQVEVRGVNLSSGSELVLPITGSGN